MSRKKLLEFGLKEADAFQKNFKIIFDRLVRGYKSMMGKEPEGLDLLKVKMEAREKAIGTTKVVNQKGLTLDPDKPIIGGTQEGIETIKTKFDEFNLSKDDPMGDLEKIVKGEGDTGLPKKPSDTDLVRLGIENLKNPKRPGGPLDPVVGITRTLARRILDKKGIKIDRREDPLDIFLNNFGVGVGTDVQNLAEEIAEAESTGRQLKPIDDLIEIEGLFNVQPTENPDMGMTDEELLQKLEKDLKEKEILEDFDPTDRTENAKGGLISILNL